MLERNNTIVMTWGEKKVELVTKWKGYKPLSKSNNMKKWKKYKEIVILGLELASEESSPQSYTAPHVSCLLDLVQLIYQSITRIVPSQKGAICSCQSRWIIGARKSQ